MTIIIHLVLIIKKQSKMKKVNWKTTYDEPKRWQLHNINEIMNTVVTGWKPFSNPRMFTGYGRQRGWERDVSGNELPGNEDGFVELTEEECCQLELPKEWIA